MTTYNAFAYIYDELMSDAPYEEWLNYFKRCHQMYLPEGKKVLDVACGTGTISILLKEEGFDVTGVDISDDMLAIAQLKAMEKGFHLPLYQQDMREMERIGQFDIATVFCDSLNYLQTENDLLHTFLSINKQLMVRGLLLFDVHSIFKIDNIFIGNTFSLTDEDIAYIWNCYEGPFPNSVEHDLSFFVLDESSMKYDRYDETHIQRAFSLEVYEKILKETGFEILAIHGGFDEENYHPECERIFFSARKIENK